jgi:hypothetical protein
MMGKISRRQLKEQVYNKQNNENNYFIKDVNENFIKENVDVYVVKNKLKTIFGFANLIENLPENSDILNTLYDIHAINYIYILKGQELSTYRKIETKKEIIRLYGNNAECKKYTELFIYILEYYNLT